MKQIENRKDTIIYGGAFNPPTRAHQVILQACIDHAGQNNADVWLLPSGDRTDKTINVSRENRLRMINALKDDVVKRTVQVHVETSELDKTEQTETFDTVLYFDETYPDRRFIWVYGSDSVETMPEWYMGEWLFDNLPMLVIERPGAPIKKLGGYASRLRVDTTAISSTKVRNRLAANEAIDDLVSPSVLACLQQLS